MVEGVILPKPEIEIGNKHTFSPEEGGFDRNVQ